jgi:hypothetical protein
MGLPVTVDLDGYHGDSWTQTFRLWTGDAPADLTGMTAASWAILLGDDPSLAESYVQLEVAVDVARSEVTITFPPTLALGRYRYDLELTKPDATVTTWVRGQIEMAGDVTHAV